MLTALTTRERRIQQFFRLSVFLKGVHAILEIIGGILLFVVSPSSISSVIVYLTEETLVKDPNDFIANALVHFGGNLTLSTAFFAGLYLFSHGVIKIVLVIALLKNRLWAYPWSLVVLGIFILYQIYRYSVTHSVGLIALSIFDLVVMWLIWQEYKIVKNHLAK